MSDTKTESPQSITSFSTLEMNQLGGSITLENESGGDANNFQVGEQWKLTINRGPANTELHQLMNCWAYPPPFKTVGKTDAQGNLTLTGTVGVGETAQQPLWMLFSNPYPGYVDPNAPAGYRGVFVASAPLPVDLNAGAPLVVTPTAAPPQSVSSANPVVVSVGAPATPGVGTSTPTVTVATPVATQPAQVNPQVLPLADNSHVSVLNTVVPSATMIQYTSDFTGLTYLDASGQTVTVLYTDGQHFNDLVVIRSAQIAALAANQSAKNAYNLTVQNAQISVSAGRPAPTLPTAPLQEIVANDGTVTYQTFPAGTLQVLVPRVVNAPNSGQIKTTVNLPADPVAQQTAAQTVMMAKIDAIIAALQAKGIM